MPADPTRTQTVPDSPPTAAFDEAFDAGLAAAFGGDLTPGGWSQPPLLRDDPSDYSPLVQPSSPEMPRAAGERYQLFGEIARGGMGVVLKGRDPDLGRDLAFKVLKTELAGRPAAIQRFVEEAQVGGQLQHPGVVPVYEVGRFADGRPYFSMKLVKGRTLADLLAVRPDPAADRGKYLRHFLQVCQTVAYAHSKGVIHRDLKPANVMVGAFDEVLVMDWGLAKVLPRGGMVDEAQASREPERPEDEPTVIRTARAGSGPDTAAGSVMGTPAFMSPEQAAGEVEKLDGRADVFGLGAVMCVILTGKPPYVAADSEAVRLMAVRGQLVDAFARLDGCGADAELVSLAKRCLSADRDARPRHAGEVAAAVAGHLAGVEDRAHRAELDRAAAQAEAREQRKRRRVQLALAGSLGLLLLGGGAFGWWQDRQATARRAQMARNAEAVASLLGRCEDALRADDADRATAILEEADRRLAEAGGDAARDRAGRCRADLAVLRELDAIDTDRWTPVKNELPALKDLGPRWRAAFAGYGVAVGEATAGEAAARVGGSSVRDRLLTALDLLLIADPDPGVRAVLRAADPDPFRDAVRDAVAVGIPARVAELANQPAALDQPPWLAAALGQYGSVPPLRQRGVLRAALRSRPGDLTLLMGLGNSYSLLERDTAERVRWYQAAVAAHPRSLIAHVRLGAELCDRVRDYDAAIDCFRAALALDPDYAYARYNLGVALQGKKDYDGAIASYREAVRLVPKYAPAHAALGGVLSDKGRDYGAAIASYRAALALDPTDAHAHFGLGVALQGKKDYDGAIASFREAARLDPKNHIALGIVGTILCDVKRDYDGAIVAFEEVLRLDPTDARAHANLGAALAGRGELERAIACYQTAVRLDPKLVNAQYLLGCGLHNKGNLVGAIAAYREVVRLDPTHARAHCNLGFALWERGDFDGAVACCREAIRHDPRLANAHYNLGNALRDRGDLDGAVAAYREVIRLDPTYPEAHCNLGYTLRLQGKLVEAVAMLRMGHELGRRRKGWPYPSAKWVADCEREMELKGLIAPMPRPVGR